MSVWIAAARGDVDTVTRYLADGGDADRRDVDGRTPLMHACQHGQLAVVELLLNAGASLEEKDGRDGRDGRDGKDRKDRKDRRDEREEGDDAEQSCALLEACQGYADAQTRLEIVRLLLDAGASPHVTNSQRDTPLLAAVGSEDPELVRLLLSRGADVNAADLEGQTPLLAALSTDEDRDAIHRIVEDLLAAGADVQHADHEGQTPLMLAAANAYTDLVQQLLAAGAAVDAIDNEGRSALTRAIESLANLTCDTRQSTYDLDEKLEALKQLGIDANSAVAQSLLSSDGSGPNQLAFTMSGAESVEQFETTRAAGIAWLNQIIDLLLQHHCPYGNSAPDLAKVGRWDLLRQAQAQGLDLDLNATDPSGQTALTEAVDRGDVDAVRTLLELGADPNAANYFEETPLMAVKHSRRGLACARLLVDAGADLNWKADEGVSLLEATVNDGDPEKVEFFLQLGADARQGTSLLRAAQRGNAAIVQMLLRHGADPQATMPADGQAMLDEFEAGTTPLMVAAAQGFGPIVELLLAAGADPRAADRSGRTALELAMQHGQLQIADRLRSLVDTVSRTTDYTAALFPSVESGNVEHVRECLDHGADANVRADYGLTPLIVAARDGHQPIVELLLAAGADANARSDAGYSGNHTPLRCAVARDHTEIVRQLLAAGADPTPMYEYSSIPAEKRNTIVPSLGSALHDAARNGNQQVVDLLLAHGADVNLRDEHSGETPLVAAVRCRQWSTARHLLDRGALRLPQDADYLEVLDFPARSSTAEFADSIRQLEALCGAPAEELGNMPGAFALTVASDDAPADYDSSEQGCRLRFAADEKLDRKKWRTLDAAYDDCLRRGHLLIDSGMPFLGGDKRFLYLLPTDNIYAVLACLSVRGNEVELSTSDIIQWLREFAREQPFRLRGCRFDTVVIELLSRPANVEAAAQALYEFCPDLVQQNFGTLGALVNHLENHRLLTLWWD